MRERPASDILPSDEAASIIALLRAHLHEVSREAAREIEARVPEYVRPHDPRYAETLFQTVFWSNSRFIDLLEDANAPLEEFLDFFREIGAGEAKEGRKPELWQTAFRIGTGTTVRSLSEIAEAHPGVSAAAIGQVVQQVLGFQNQIMAALFESHSSAKARAAGERVGLRRRLVDLLVSPSPDAGELRELAAEARWPVPAAVAAVAVHRRDRDVLHRRPSPAMPLPGCTCPNRA